MKNKDINGFWETQTLAIKGTVSELKGEIANQLNALGKELFDAYAIIDYTRAHIEHRKAEQGIQKLSAVLDHWLALQEKNDYLLYGSVDGESEDINTHMLFTQFMRIEQQIAIYYQSAYKMLVEKGFEAQARTLPVPPCIFPDDAGPDNWEFWTYDEIYADAA